MNRDIRDIDVIHMFIKALERAGFSGSCHDFEEIIRNLHYEPQKGLLREFFLAYEGLAEFRLKSGVIRMLRKYSNVREVEKLKKNAEWNNHTIHPDDWHKFEETIDLDQLRLLSSLRRGERRIPLALAIERISSWHSRVWGTIWEASWFRDHQEFLPEDWVKVLSRKIDRVNNSGRVYFPGARLVVKDLFDPDQIHYPFLEGYRSNLDLITRNEDEAIDRNSFFVSVGRKTKLA